MFNTKLLLILLQVCFRLSVIGAELVYTKI